MTQEAANESWKYIDTIPIDRIRILNPRVRDKRKYQLLIENLSKVGLKRPITVSRKSSAPSEAMYDLVCGQGRVEAYIALGQTHIPAMIIEANKPKVIKGMTADAIARMEKELSRLQEKIATIQDSYGKDHLELTIVKGYLKRLLENVRVVSYLAVNHPEYLPEFQSIIELNSTSGLES